MSVWGEGGYRKRERVIIFKQEYSDIKGIFQYHKPNTFSSFNDCYVQEKDWRSILASTQ